MTPERPTVALTNTNQRRRSTAKATTETPRPKLLCWAIRELLYEMHGWRSAF